MLRAGLPVLLLAASLAFPASAQPSVAQCKSTWEPLVKGERALNCSFRGGARPTKELHGKHYLTPIGTCWDYDVVALQRCGCRTFLKASICCRKGSTASSQCEWRIGNSIEADCKKYGQPPFGLSGTTEPEECKARRQSMGCFKKKFQFGEGVATGPCQASPAFECARGFDAQTDFLDGRCGPTPEDCGCTLLEECSKEDPLKCYKQWKADKEAVDCYWNKKHDNNYKRWKCYDDLKKSRGKVD